MGWCSNSSLFKQVDHEVLEGPRREAATELLGLFRWGFVEGANHLNDVAHLQRDILEVENLINLANDSYLVETTCI